MQDESLGPISRWLKVLIPLSVTAALVAFALRTSSGESTPILGRYTVRYSFFLAGMFLAAVASYWAAMSLARWTRILAALRTVPFLRLCVLLAIGLFLSDFFVNLHYTLIGVPYLLAIATFAAGRDGSLSRIHFRGVRSVNKLVFLMSSTFMSLAFAELVFRFFIVEPSFPESERQFQEIVMSQWPGDVQPGVESKTCPRILGLADSFGVYGGPSNYLYLLSDGLSQAGTPGLSSTGVALVRLGHELLHHHLGAAQAATRRGNADGTVRDVFRRDLSGDAAFGRGILQGDVLTQRRRDATVKMEVPRGIMPSGPAWAEAQTV